MCGMDPGGAHAHHIVRVIVREGHCFEQSVRIFVSKCHCSEGSLLRIEHNGNFSNPNHIPNTSNQWPYALFGVMTLRSNDPYALFGVMTQYALFGVMVLRSNDPYALFGVVTLRSNEHFALFGVMIPRSNDIYRWGLRSVVGGGFYMGKWEEKLLLTIIK